MKIRSVQFLRAVAALLVVYTYSIDLTLRFSKAEPFYFLNKTGLIGQDFALVICGFVITYTAAQYRNPASSFLFLQKRFFRINPIYYLASFIYIGSHFIYLWLWSQMLPMPVFMMYGALADTILIVPTTANLSEFRPLLFLGWILAFEWLFYVLFFIVRLINLQRSILLLGLLVAVLASLGAIFHPTDLRLSVLTNPILLEFLLGIVICQLYLRLPKISSLLSGGLVLAGTAWIVFLVFYGYGSIWNYNTILTGSQSLQRVLLWGLPAACILTGCVFLEKSKRLEKLWHNRLCQLTGAASYSLYLIHLSVFSFLSLLYQQTGLRLPPDVGIYLQVIIAVLAGIAFYWWIERPLMQWFNQPSRQYWLFDPRTQTS